MVQEDEICLIMEVRSFGLLGVEQLLDGISFVFVLVLVRIFLAAQELPPGRGRLLLFNAG